MGRKNDERSEEDKEFFEKKTSQERLIDLRICLSMSSKKPNDWSEISLGKIGQFLGGGTPSTKMPAYWNGNIQWTTSKRLGSGVYLNSGERTITQQGLKRSSTSLIPEGNLLMGTRVGVGKVAVNRIDMAISQDLTGVIVDINQYLPEFVALQIKSPRLQEYFRQGSKGFIIKGVSREDVRRFPLWMPSHPEQKKIAAVLLKIQKAIEIQEKIIETMRKLKKSTMEHVFTYGLRGEKTKMTEIGEIPKSWKVCKFGNFATLHRGYDLPVHDRRQGNIPVIGSNGIVGYHAEAKVNGPGVVIGRSGTIGISYYIDEDYWPLNTGLYVSDFHDNNPLYTHYFFNWFDFRRYAAGVSVPTLNRNLVHGVMIGVAKRNEQGQIASILHHVDEKLGLHESKKSALQGLFKTMLNKLMTGEIRVKDLDINISEVEVNND